MRAILADQLLTIDLGAAPFDGGGEAGVYFVPPERRRVAKVYFQDAATRREKVEHMIANPPWDPPTRDGRRRYAWPEEALLDPAGRAFVGFVMPAVAGEQLYKIANPAARPAFAECYAFRLQAAASVAQAVAALHELGYVVGDVNELNVFIDAQARATLIDLDSIQVRAGARVYRCPVGKPEYTPPELHPHTFTDIDRAAHHDAFGLAVLVHKLLAGTHPFAGCYTGAGKAPSLVEAIAQGLWPDRPGGCPDYLPSPQAPPFDSHPEPLRQLWTRAFVTGRRRPEDRPAAAQWVSAIHAVQPPPWSLAGVAHAFRPAGRLSARAAGLLARNKWAFAAALLAAAAGYYLWPARGAASLPAALTTKFRPEGGPRDDKGLPLPPLLEELLRRK